MFIEDKIENLSSDINCLRNSVEKLEGLIRCLIPLVKPMLVHLPDCDLKEFQDNVSSVEFTESYCVYCKTCKNKYKHHGRCIRGLLRKAELEVPCECPNYKIKKFLEGSGYQGWV